MAIEPHEPRREPRVHEVQLSGAVPRQGGEVRQLVVDRREQPFDCQSAGRRQESVARGRTGRSDPRSPLGTAPLLVHLLALGAWLGCVAVEAVVEVGARRSAVLRAAAADLHWRIDRFVEIPIFTTVVASGAWMLEPARLAEPVYGAKIALGLTAVAVNALCVVPVFRRAHDAPEAYDRHARWIWLAFATGVPAGVGALVLGLRLAGLG